MAIVEEAGDLVVGEDPLAVGGERRHGAEAIAALERTRAPLTGHAPFESTLKSEQPHGEWMQAGDEVDAPVGHPLVLGHQDRRAAGMRAGNNVELVHTDWSVGTLPRCRRA
jgi:hypothetical protein